MLYWLYELLYEPTGIFRFLRIFKYITIRAGAAFVIGFLIFVLTGNKIIQLLNKKNFSDRIKNEIKDMHVQKAGTPTMGGIFIYLYTMIVFAIFANFHSVYTYLFLAAGTLSFLIGFIDDMVKLKNKKNGEGISAKLKFILLILVSAIVIFLLTKMSGFNTKLTIPIVKMAPKLGFGYLIILFLVLMGASNSVNLSDGLDGLAISLSIVSIFTLSLIAYLTGNTIYADYLNLPYIQGAGEVAVFGITLIGVSLGFLWYNFYPAQVFMGDAGSLFLGFVIGLMAICVKQEILLIIIGGIFFMEALSVILQVSFFKWKKKRIFKMAPIHHHFEKMAIPESKIVIRFVIISVILSLIAMVAIKVR
ncbi:phospho-N-acetylmuramoyl-pentapeptide-transferase [bacterium]|nr:phospho-N-acetylmuramoyl-pentapeptide-transferase [bacterium]